MARLRESDQLPVETRRCKERIERDSARLPEKQCRNCNSRHFQRHARRLRWFLPVVASVVYPILCLLYRWRCVNCGATFTHLPASCAPFKRFLREEIEVRSRRYVETERMTYRLVVKERGAAVVYDDAIAKAESTEAEKEAEGTRALAASTVHRWIGWIAACRESWQPMVRLAREVHRGPRLNVFAICVTKWRSRERKRVLEVCALLLRALQIVRGINSTRFATLGSSP
jgi:hypothetical protein